MTDNYKKHEAQLKQLRRNNYMLAAACIISSAVMLNIIYTFYAPNTMLEGSNAKRINPTDPYVVQAATDIYEECADFEYLKTDCLYWRATQYVYDNVDYSDQKLDDGRKSAVYRWWKYELPANYDAQYNEHVLTGRTAAVCNDMSVVLCSILRSLNLTCELASRMVIEDNKFSGHMYVEGVVDNETIRCDPTAGYCYDVD